MKLLLDTHSFLWFIGGDERLPPNTYLRTRVKCFNDRWPETDYD